MSVDIINTNQDILEGLNHLKQLDPTLIPIIKRVPSVPLRRDQGGFEGLVRIIIGQHVSTASASAIHARFTDQINPVTPTNYLETHQDVLIKVGLTRAKQNTIGNIAQAINTKTLDLDAISSLDEKNAIAQLTALKGIGPWTAEVYLLFCAGHPDIFAAGDLAIREAVRQAYNMSERPNEKDLRAFAAKWAPYRGIASRLFWAYYAMLKGKEKGLPL
jgi:DNA-3-methyladenine glycosylase II